MPRAHLEHMKHENAKSSFEVLTAEELAGRWRVPTTWIRDQVRSRATDPIPHVKLGRYVRFSWGSPQLEEWWSRRQSSRDFGN